MTTGNSQAPVGSPEELAAGEEQERLFDLISSLQEKVNDLAATTLAGFRAKGRAIMCTDYGEMAKADEFGGMLAGLMHDLTEGSLPDGKATHGRGGRRGNRGMIGARMTVERAHDALSGAKTLLYMLVDEMKRAGEKDAGDNVASWVDALGFVARTLGDEAEEMWTVLLDDDKQRLVDKTGAAKR